MLTQQQTLQQTFTPWFEQSLRILQAPAMELRRIVAEELANNPTLEERDEGQGMRDEEAGASQQDPFDTPDTPDILNSPSSLVPRPSSLSSDTPDRPISAQDFLLNQLDPTERNDPVVIKIIGSLDDAGYFRGDLAAIAHATHRPLTETAETLRRIQSTLEPAGIAARDLSECLLLQLERLGRADSLAARIVRDHLDLVAQHKTRDLVRRLDSTETAVETAIDEIRSLEPRPGNGLVANTNPVIFADIIVERGDDGLFHARLEERGVPRLRIADTYLDMLVARDQPREVLAFLRSKIRSGRAFLRAIEQRNTTLLAIAETFVSRQQSFLENGRAALVPMTYAHIARTLGIHESTVSRAIAGKYMSTPHGLFAMKDLFRPRLTTRDGGEIADTAVREAIMQIVRAETKPLGDQAIAEALAQRGIAIARRTVAKYRTQLGILPKHLRKN